LEAVEHIISGGPLLLRDGIPTTPKEHDAEGFERAFHDWWYPRTAISVKADGTLILVTITGKSPKVNWGVKLSKLTELLLEWGAKDALNLDSGGWLDDDGY
jgi:exopolysaccharide biosynthesis protein